MTDQILAIDDEEICIDQIELFLAPFYSVQVARNGIDGINRIVELNSRIKVILLDMMMPDISGIDVLKYLQNNQEYSHIPVIMQTGIADQNVIDEGFNLGAKVCLIKPFSRKDLKEAIEKCTS